MAVSKRTRYEVLRRDGHKCRYCGLVAAETELTVDHVLPVALGGSDDPSNLVAACEDCNQGKASSGPDEPLVADIAADALRWAAALKQAAYEAAVDRGGQARLEWEFDTKWLDWTDSKGNHIYRPDSWRVDLSNWLTAGLDIDTLLDLIPIAMHSKAVSVWKYFAGCAWRRLNDRQERARQIIRDTESVH
jgi:hypothetical protein